MNSLGEAPTDWRGCFADAAAWFVELTSAARPHLAQPALGEWTVRDLIGHASRSWTTVVDYLAAAGPIDLDAAADYFRAAADVDPANVAERGRSAGASLGSAPAEVVANLAERAAHALAEAPDDSLVATPLGVMALAEYLPTRTFELAVHGCDLAAAVGLPLSVPASAGESAARLAAALLGDWTGEVLLALTGRRPLPPGFSVLAPPRAGPSRAGHFS